MSNTGCIVRLLLDEDSGARTLQKALRDEGHDVERVVDAAALGPGASDDAVLAAAIAENRVIVTKNGADFVDLVESANATDHPGILVVHVTNDGSSLPVSGIVRAVRNIAQTYPSTRGIVLSINQHVW